MCHVCGYEKYRIVTIERETCKWTAKNIQFLFHFTYFVKIHINVYSDTRIILDTRMSINGTLHSLHHILYENAGSLMAYDMAMIWHFYDTNKLHSINVIRSTDLGMDGRYSDSVGWADNNKTTLRVLFVYSGCCQAKRRKSLFSREEKSIPECDSYG
jgi:hypothetical protein